MFFIVGLGNPGKEYEQTRHNAGFMALDFLRKKLGFPRFEEKTKFQMALAEGEYEGEKIILGKPLTYMNRSGEAVRSFVSYYKIAPAHLIVIYDDVDLSLGQLRIRKKGSPGTHNGIRSITEALGSGNFARFRIGIGGGIEETKKNLKDFVLEKPHAKEWKMLEEACQNAAEAVADTLKASLDFSMNRWNKGKED